MRRASLAKVLREEEDGGADGGSPAPGHSPSSPPRGVYVNFAGRRPSVAAAGGAGTLARLASAPHGSVAPRAATHAELGAAAVKVGTAKGRGAAGGGESVSAVLRRKSAAAAASQTLPPAPPTAERVLQQDDPRIRAHLEARRRDNFACGEAAAAADAGPPADSERRAPLMGSLVIPGQADREALRGVFRSDDWLREAEVLSPSAAPWEHGQAAAAADASSGGGGGGGGGDDDPPRSAVVGAPRSIAEIHRRFCETVERARRVRAEIESGKTVKEAAGGSSAAAAASAPPPTPRTQYSRAQGDKMLTRVSILMRLDQAAMQRVRREFDKHCTPDDDGLDMYEFAAVVERELQRGRNADGVPCASSSSLAGDSVEALIEMFREIDVNGDGTMTWEEFTTYMVELADTYYENSYGGGARKFRASRQEDASRHEYRVNLCRFVPSTGKLLVMERGSSRFKVYSDDMRCLRVVTGHRGPVMDAADIPEHGVVATCSGDGGLHFWGTRRWNAWDLTARWHLARPAAALCWTSGVLYSAGVSGRIQGWNVERNELAYSMPGHTDVAMGLCGMPALGRLASASLDTTVRTWDCETGAQVSLLRGHTRAAFAATFAAGHSVLVTAGLDNFALGWSPTTRVPLFSLKTELPQSHVVGVRALGAHEVVLCDNTGLCHAYDLRNCQLTQSFAVPRMRSGDHISSVEVDEASGTLWASGRRLHKFCREQEARADHADDAAIEAAVWNPVSMSFLTASGRTVKQWSGLTGRLEAEWKDALESTVTSLCLDDRRRRVFAGGHGGGIRVFDLSNGAFMKSMDSHRAEVTGLVYNDKTQELGSASWDRRVLLHVDTIAARTTTRREYAGHRGDVTAVALSQAAQLLASGSADCRVEVHQWDSPTSLGEIECDARVRALAFLGDAPLLAVADDSGTVSVWIVQGQIELGFRFRNGEVRAGAVPAAVTGLAYDDEADTLWTADDAGRVRAWDLGRATARLSGCPPAGPGRTHSRRGSVFEHVTLDAQSDSSSSSSSSSEGEDDEEEEDEKEEGDASDGTKSSEEESDDERPRLSLTPLQMVRGLVAATKTVAGAAERLAEVGQRAVDWERDRKRREAANRSPAGKMRSLQAAAAGARRQSVAELIEQIKSDRAGGGGSQRASLTSRAGGSPQDGLSPRSRLLATPVHVLLRRRLVLQGELERDPLRPRLDIAAHGKGGARGVAVVPSVSVPSSVLSWGADGCAHVWSSADGSALGSLEQGFSKSGGARVTPWLLRVDLEQRVAEESAAVERAREHVSHRLRRFARVAAAEAAVLAVAPKQRAAAAAAAATKPGPPTPAALPPLPKGPALFRLTSTVPGEGVGLEPGRQGRRGRDGFDLLSSPRGAEGSPAAAHHTRAGSGVVHLSRTNDITVPREARAKAETSTGAGATGDGGRGGTEPAAGAEQHTRSTLALFGQKGGGGDDPAMLRAPRRKRMDSLVVGGAGTAVRGRMARSRARMQSANARSAPNLRRGSAVKEMLALSLKAPAPAAAAASEAGEAGEASRGGPDGEGIESSLPEWGHTARRASRRGGARSESVFAKSGGGAGARRPVLKRASTNRGGRPDGQGSRSKLPRGPVVPLAHPHYVLERARPRQHSALAPPGVLRFKQRSVSLNGTQASAVERLDHALSSVDDVPAVSGGGGARNVS